MKNKELIKQMLQMQQNLNDATNGINWEDGKTCDGKLISWRRCIYMECAELIDSFSWKHWKNINEKANVDNIRIELVDIWHFIMSLILQNHHKECTLDVIAEEISQSLLFGNFCKEPYDINAYNQYEIMNEIEILIHETSKNSINFANLLKTFFAICLKCGINLRILFEIYMGKNVLNKFRQDNGYKSGTYKKIWNKKEDNEVLNELINGGIYNADELYSTLQKEYQKAIK